MVQLVSILKSNGDEAIIVDCPRHIDVNGTIFREEPASSVDTSRETRNGATVNKSAVISDNITTSSLSTCDLVETESITKISGECGNDTTFHQGEYLPSSLFNSLKQKRINQKQYRARSKERAIKRRQDATNEIQKIKITNKEKRNKYTEEREELIAKMHEELKRIDRKNFFSAKKDSLKKQARAYYRKEIRALKRSIINPESFSDDVKKAWSGVDPLLADLWEKFKKSDMKVGLLIFDILILLRDLSRAESPLDITLDIFKFLRSQDMEDIAKITSTVTKFVQDLTDIGMDQFNKFIHPESSTFFEKGSQLMGKVISFLDRLVGSGLFSTFKRIILMICSYKLLSKDISAHFYNFFGYEKPVDGVSAFTTILQAIQSIFKFGEQVSEGIPIEVAMFGDDAKDTVVSRLESLIYYKDKLYIGVKVDGYMNYREFIRQLTGIIAELKRYTSTTRAKDPQYRLYSRLLLSAEGLYMEKKKMLDSSMRVTPLSFVICGAPGVGKSTLLIRIAQIICFYQNLPFCPSMVFHRVTSSDYWEGYDPFIHQIIHYSELGNMTAKRAQLTQDKALEELTSICDGQPVVANMAALENKGKIFITPIALLADTNNKFMNIPHMYMNCAAYYRRNIYIEVMVKPEYRLDGSVSLDTHKANAAKDNTDVWVFNVSRYVPLCADKVQEIKLLENGSFEDLVTVLGPLITKHLEAQNKLISDMNEEFEVAKYDRNLRKNTSDQDFTDDNLPDDDDFENLHDIERMSHTEGAFMGILNVNAEDEGKDDAISFVGKNYEQVEREIYAKYTHPDDYKTRCKLIAECVQFFSVSKEEEAKNWKDRVIERLNRVKATSPPTADPETNSELFAKQYREWLKGDISPESGVIDAVRATEFFHGYPITERILAYRAQWYAGPSVGEYFSELGLTKENFYGGYCWGMNMLFGHRSNLVNRFLCFLVTLICLLLVSTFLPWYLRIQMLLSLVILFLMLNDNIFDTRELGVEFAHRVVHPGISNVGAMFGVPSTLSSHWLQHRVLYETLFSALTIAASAYATYFVTKKVVNKFKEANQEYKRLKPLNEEIALTNREHRDKINRLYNNKAYPKTTFVGGCPSHGVEDDSDDECNECITNSQKKVEEISKRDISVVFDSEYQKEMNKQTELELRSLEESAECVDTFFRIENKITPTQWNVLTHYRREPVHKGDVKSMWSFINSNVRAVRVLDNGKYRFQYLYGLFSNVAVINTHFFGGKTNVKMEVCMHGEFADFEIPQGYNTAGNNKVQFTFVTGENRIDIGNDMSIILLTGDLFRDYRKHLLDEEMNDKDMFEGFYAGEQLNVIYSGEDMYLRNEGIIHGAFKGSYSKHRPGQCGRPLVVRYNGGSVIAGFHIGGDANTSDTFFASFNKTKILQALDKIPAYNKLMRMASMNIFPEVLVMPSVKSATHYEDLRGLIYFGKMKGDVNVHQDSKFEKTPYKEEIECIWDEELHFKPQKVFMRPFLQPTKYNGDIVRPMNVNLRSLAKQKSSLPLGLIIKCVDVFTQHLLKGLRAKGITQMRPVTMKTAINGVVGDTYAKRINTNAGAGYGFVGKKSDILPIFQELDNEVIRMPVEELQQRVNEAVRNYLSGKISCEANQMSLKDEMRDKAKVEAGKTRAFFAGSSVLLVLSRMFLSPLYTCMVENSDVFCCALGIDTHREGDKLYHDLMGFSPKVIDGDFQSFDTSIPTVVRWATSSVMFNVFKEMGYNEFSLKIVSGLLTDGIFPFIISYLDVFMAAGQQPSGKYGTAEDNSLVCTMIMLLTWYSTPDLWDKHFFDYVLPRNYGDDLLASIKEDVIDSFNNFNILEMCTEYLNMGYTSSTKDKPLTKYSSIEDIVFLKRRLVYNVVLERQTMLLDMESILRSITWFENSGKVSVPTQLGSALVSAMREIYFHVDETKYEILRHKVCNVFKNKLGLWLDVPSYSSLTQSLRV